jgi:hypothetical protein
MIDFAIGYLIPAAIGVLSGYIINQLPPLKSSQENKRLAVVIVIEMAIGGAILAWLKDNHLDPGKRVTESFGYIVLGAMFATGAQLMWKVSSNRSKAPHSHDSNSQAHHPSHSVWVKGTKMQGTRNTVRVTRQDVRLEDTQIEGDEQALLIDESSQPSEQTKGS